MLSGRLNHFSLSNTLDIKPLSDAYLTNILQVLFVSVHCDNCFFFSVQKLLNLVPSHLLILVFTVICSPIHNSFTCDNLLNHLFLTNFYMKSAWLDVGIDTSAALGLHLPGISFSIFSL